MAGGEVGLEVIVNVGVGDGRAVSVGAFVGMGVGVFEGMFVAVGGMAVDVGRGASDGEAIGGTAEGCPDMAGAVDGEQAEAAIKRISKG